MCINDDNNVIINNDINDNDNDNNINEVILMKLMNKKWRIVMK